MKIYTFGYSDRKFTELFDLVATLNIPLVVDIRENPLSRWTPWNRERLKKVFGKRYTWIRELGNRTREPNDILLVDEEAGLYLLERLLRRCGSVLLLCACKDAARCHRSYIAKTMKERVEGLEIEHL